MTTLPEKVYYQINRGSWTRGKSTRWSGDDGMMSFPGKKIRVEWNMLLATERRGQEQRRWLMQSRE